jgi:acyl carrier protein
MNDTSEFDQRLREVLADVFELPPSAIGQGFRRDDAPTWDSLAHLRMISALEEAFAVRFTMQEVEAMDRFETVRRFTADRLQAA